MSVERRKPPLATYQDYMSERELHGDAGFVLGLALDAALQPIRQELGIDQISCDDALDALRSAAVELNEGNFVIKPNLYAREGIGAIIYDCHGQGRNILPQLKDRAVELLREGYRSKGLRKKYFGEEEKG